MATNLLTFIEETGYRLIGGGRINSIVQAINGLYNGTTPFLSGAFNGTIGVTAPNTGKFTTVTLKQGANSKAGTFTLTGATPVTVGNTSITANSVVVTTIKTVGGTVSPNAPNVLTITPGTGFTVGGTALDTSVYNYIVLESAV